MPSTVGCSAKNNDGVLSPTTAMQNSMSYDNAHLPALA